MSGKLQQTVWYILLLFWNISNVKQFEEHCCKVCWPSPRWRTDLSTAVIFLSFPIWNSSPDCPQKTCIYPQWPLVECHTTVKHLCSCVSNTHIILPLHVTIEMIKDAVIKASSRQVFSEEVRFAILYFDKISLFHAAVKIWAALSAPNATATKLWLMLSIYSQF